MATNGIDFVIGGKNQAAPALASTEKVYHDSKPARSL